MEIIMGHLDSILEKETCLSKKTASKKGTPTLKAVNSVSGSKVNFVNTPARAHKIAAKAASKTANLYVK